MAYTGGQNIAESRQNDHSETSHGAWKHSPARGRAVKFRKSTASSASIPASGRLIQRRAYTAPYLNDSSIASAAPGVTA